MVTHAALLLQACGVEEYLGVKEGGEVQVEGEGDSPINLAEAAAHVLLEALHMHCQQGRAPAHHNGFVKTTTHFQIESHNTGQPSTVAMYGIVGQEIRLNICWAGCNDSYAWVQLSLGTVGQGCM